MTPFHHIPSPTPYSTEPRQPVTDPDQLRDIDVLSEHYLRAWGMTQGSADRCACDARTYPATTPSDEEAGKRRARAFATHQAEMLAAARTAEKNQ